LIVRFAAYSGLRAGEIAGLNVGDLDLLTPVPRFTPGGEPAVSRAIEICPGAVVKLAR